MDRNLKICAVQTAASADRAQNTKKAAELVELAANEGARIIALPELFSTPWFPASIDRTNFSLAEAADGPTLTAVREEAARHGVVVVANIFEEDSGRYFNTAFVVGPDGGIIGRYRKVHVPQIPLWEEKSYFEPGDTGFPVFETPFAKIGVQICWDVFFPEGFRILALKGAEVIIAPTASAFIHSHGKWERAISAAAHANGVYILRVNRVGAEASQDFYGRSFCAGPDGEFIGEPSGASVGIVMADIDLSEIARTRSEWVFLKDRRPEDYKEISEAMGRG
jgi:N-carbamoylputrescine amidase